MRPSPTLQAMAHQPGVEGVPVDSTLSVNFRASNSPSRETAPDGGFNWSTQQLR